MPVYEDYIIETEASINNDGFVSVSGDPIDNYGEVRQITQWCLTAKDRSYTISKLVRLTSRARRMAALC